MLTGLVVDAEVDLAGRVVTGCEVSPPPSWQAAMPRRPWRVADFLFDHTVYSGCLAGTDYGATAMGQTSPGVLARAEREPAPRAGVHGFATIADLMRGLDHGGAFFHQALRAASSGVYEQHAARTAAVWDDLAEFLLAALPGIEQAGRRAAAFVTNGAFGLTPARRDDGVCETGPIAREGAAEAHALERHRARARHLVWLAPHAASPQEQDREAPRGAFDGVPPTALNAAGAWQEALVGSPILEDGFTGIDLMRVIRSFDPCLPVRVRVQGLTLLHTPTGMA